jgi:hypothetical protein
MTKENPTDSLVTDGTAGKNIVFGQLSFDFMPTTVSEIAACPATDLAA